MLAKKVPLYKVAVHHYLECLWALRFFTSNDPGPQREWSTLCKCSLWCVV